LEALKSLTSSQPVLRKNRGHLLLHATVSELPTTNLLTLVLKEQKKSNFLITAFPGPTALPLPSTKFSTEFNETYNKFLPDYWQYENNFIIADKYKQKIKWVAVQTHLKMQSMTMKCNKEK
jgi:hypothetical protein